jgi:hypothetical protein
MSFADILNQEATKIEQGNNQNEGVKYPQAKQKRLFFGKGEKELIVQVLPTADLFGLFAKPTRKIFLQAKTSKGKDIKTNFTLDAEANPGSILEQKITEWGQKGMIPNGFGGQTTPKRYHTVNVVKVVNVNNSFVQERDEQGQLVVRLFDMPQSAYASYIRQLRDPMLNTSGTDLSFMDINKPAAVKISKPAPGGMEYQVQVYTNVILPPLGQGWENQLEDLEAHTQATERLENGQDWVNAFIDMKEGRAPQRSNQQSNNTVPDANVNPFAQAQQTQQPAPAANPFTQPTPAAPAQPAANPFATPNNIGLPEDALPNFEDSLSNLPPKQPNQSGNPFGQAAPAQPAPAAPSQPAPSAPTHNVQANGNGLLDIEAMLEKELNGGL